MKEAVKFNFIEELDGGRVERCREEYILALVDVINGKTTRQLKQAARGKYKQAFVDYMKKWREMQASKQTKPSVPPETASDKLKSPPSSSSPTGAVAAKKPGNEDSDEDDESDYRPPEHTIGKTDDNDDDRKPAANPTSPTSPKKRRRHKNDWSERRKQRFVLPIAARSPTRKNAAKTGSPMTTPRSMDKIGILFNELTSAKKAKKNTEWRSIPM
mgnify:CR=1 FL=1